MCRQPPPIGSNRRRTRCGCRCLGSSANVASGHAIDDECCMPKLCPGSCTSTTQPPSRCTRCRARAGRACRATRAPTSRSPCAAAEVPEVVGRRAAHHGIDLRPQGGGPVRVAGRGRGERHRAHHRAGDVLRCRTTAPDSSDGSSPCSARSIRHRTAAGRPVPADVRHPPRYRGGRRRKTGTQAAPRSRGRSGGLVPGADAPFPVARHRELARRRRRPPDAGSPPPVSSAGSQLEEEAADESPPGSSQKELLLGGAVVPRSAMKTASCPSSAPAGAPSPGAPSAQPSNDAIPPNDNSHNLARARWANTGRR